MYKKWNVFTWSTYMAAAAILIPAALGVRETLAMPCAENIKNIEKLSAEQIEQGWVAFQYFTLNSSATLQNGRPGIVVHAGKNLSCSLTRHDAAMQGRNCNPSLTIASGTKFQQSGLHSKNGKVEVILAPILKEQSEPPTELSVQSYYCGAVEIRCETRPQGALTSGQILTEMTKSLPGLQGCQYNPGGVADAYRAVDGGASSEDTKTQGTK